MNPVLATARAYVAAGISIFPVALNGTKGPASAHLPHVFDEATGKEGPSWAPYRHRRPTDAELQKWFGGPNPMGIALVCGPISGNLAVFDFESDEAWKAWLGKVTAKRQQVLVGLPLVRTPSGGRHLYVRTDEPLSGGKLALDAAGKCKAEIRGEQHYVLAPGSPGAAHPTGRTYDFVRRGWLDDAATGAA